MIAKLDLHPAPSRRLVAALALSIATHALVAVGVRDSPIEPSLRDRLPGEDGPLAVTLVGLPAPPLTAIRSSEPAPVVVEPKPLPSGLPLAARPAVVKSPPAPRGATLAIRATIVFDRSEPMPARFDAAIRGRREPVVRSDLEFDPPLSIPYPLQRLEWPTTHVNRALVIAHPDGSLELGAVEFDDPDFIEAMRLAVSQSRAIGSDTASTLRYALLTIWLEREAVEPGSPPAGARPRLLSP